jgi:hypothetical protein
MNRWIVSLEDVDLDGQVCLYNHNLTLFHNMGKVLDTLEDPAGINDVKDCLEDRPLKIIFLK